MRSILPLILLLPSMAQAGMAAPPQPNLLFLITDQQSSQALSCAGNGRVKTPHLDRLAARGVRFQKSYCTFPLCCPSRGSLFTSRMPHELGIYGNDDADLAGKGVPTMGELFQSAGYETAYAGKWHLQVAFPAFKGGKIPGFEVLPLAGRDPHQVDKSTEGKGLTVDGNTAGAAIEFLRRAHAKPFLLVVSILNPHDICEYPECAALRSLHPGDPSQLPPVRPNWRDSESLPAELQKSVRRFSERSEREWREYEWVYHRLVEIADAEAGRVLDALDQAGLSGNTVVVMTSDHGEMMGAHGLTTKQKLYEEAAAVPLIVAPPAAKPGVNEEQLVSGLDILPTLLDYAGIPAPSALRGRSLRPLVEGQAIPWREFVASECTAMGDARMIRTASYKYVAYATGDHREQFFDLEQDPGELRNLVADESLAGEVGRHREWLAQWIKDTQDPFGQEVPVKAKQGRRTPGKKPRAKPASGTSVVR